MSDERARTRTEHEDDEGADVEAHGTVPDEPESDEAERARTRANTEEASADEIERART